MFSRATLHPGTRIALWMAFAVLIQSLPLPVLAAACVALFSLAAFFSGGSFLRLLRRTRWLMLSLLLIYGLATPGEALFPALGAFSPAQEGVMAGAAQAARLACMLAALALLVTNLPREELLAGLHFLLSPFRRLGAQPERIAARLWLTLHYAENRPAGGSWLRQLAAMPPRVTDTIVLPARPFTWRDLLAGAGAAVLAALLLP